MTEKTEAPDPQVEIEELRTRAENAEARSRNLEETVETLNNMVGEYTQLLADAQLTSITIKAKQAVAARRLPQASGAE